MISFFSQIRFDSSFVLIWWKNDDHCFGKWKCHWRFGMCAEIAQPIFHGWTGIAQIGFPCFHHWHIMRHLEEGTDIAKLEESNESFQLQITEEHKHSYENHRCEQRKKLFHTFTFIFFHLQYIITSSTSGCLPDHNYIKFNRITYSFAVCYFLRNINLNYRDTKQPGQKGKMVSIENNFPHNCTHSEEILKVLALALFSHILCFFRLLCLKFTSFVNGKLVFCITSVTPFNKNDTNERNFFEKFFILSLLYKMQSYVWLQIQLIRSMVVTCFAMHLYQYSSPPFYME